MYRAWETRLCIPILIKIVGIVNFRVSIPPNESAPLEPGGTHRMVRASFRTTTHMTPRAKNLIALVMLGASNALGANSGGGFRDFTQGASGLKFGQRPGRYCVTARECRLRKKPFMAEGYLTTDLLDAAPGLPAAGWRVRLWRLTESGRDMLAEAVTTADSRTDEPILSEEVFRVEFYDGLVFDAGHRSMRLGRHRKSHGSSMRCRSGSESPIRTRINTSRCCFFRTDTRPIGGR